MDNNERIMIAVDPSVLDGLIERVANLEKQLSSMTKPQLQKEYYYLKDACDIKGVNYRSLCTEGFIHFRPNNGIPDMQLNRRDCWRRSTIVEWINQSDNDLERLLKEKIRTRNVS